MNLTQSFRTLILAIVLSIGISYAYATWAPPTQTPPLGNIDAPVNVGAGSQTKQGDLSSNSFMSAAQGFFGSVGIGTASVPASLKLGVAGNVGADKYCDQSGGNCITNTGGGIQFPDSTTQTTAASGGGTITAVNAGTGLTGGGPTGNVTLNADTSVLQHRLMNSCTTGVIKSIDASGNVTCQQNLVIHPITDYCGGTAFIAAVGTSLYNGGNVNWCGSFWTARSPSWDVCQNPLIPDWVLCTQ